jgi:hypothetical protein
LLESRWAYELASGEKNWEEVRETVRDGWNRARARRRRP